MRNGYIKLHRKILDWEWYSDINTRLVFIHLLLCANWEDCEFQGVHLKRGQLATTVKELATNNKLTIQQTKTALNHLQSTNEITIATNTKFSIITLNNFDLYQSANNQNNKPITNQQQTEQQTSNNQINKPTLLYKENKNIRREECARAGNFNEVKRLFNEICVSLTPLKYDLSATQAHLVEQAQANLGDRSFEELFRRVERSDFLCGRTGGGFKASFNWILKPENIAKILDGNYDSNFSSKKTDVGRKDPWAGVTQEQANEMARHFFDNL